MSRGRAACRSCRAPILWGITTAGNAMPLNADPDPAGNVVLTGGTRRGRSGDLLPLVRVEGSPSLFPDAVDRYMPHHATCPQADDWRTR